MSALFGRKKSLEERLKENKRAINKAIRELDRERMGLERAERKLISDIKAAAQKEQYGAAKIMAKDLVRTRSYIQRFIRMRAQMQALNLRLQTVKSTEAMARCMAGMTRSMAALNKQLDLPALRQIMMDFERANEKFEMTEEMMSEGIDDVMEEEGDEEEADLVLQKTLDELGIQFAENLDGPARNAVGAQQAEAVAPSGLESRLQNL